MENDLTTGTWQDDIWCPIIIILLCTSDVGIIEGRVMQSEESHGSHLRAMSSRMKMVDGDNAGERGVMVAIGHGLCV
jgi:hypothetical protein